MLSVSGGKRHFSDSLIKVRSHARSRLEGKRRRTKRNAKILSANVYQKYCIHGCRNGVGTYRCNYLPKKHCLMAPIGACIRKIGHTAAVPHISANCSSYLFPDTKPAYLSLSLSAKEEKSENESDTINNF